MKTYKINIIEHNEAQIEVEADNVEDAEEKVREMYENGDINMLDVGYGDNGYVDFIPEATDPINPHNNHHVQ